MPTTYPPTTTPETMTTATPTDTRAALLSWAGRGGRYTLDDLEAILRGHGETLQAWIDDCNAHGFDAVYNAEALLTWLGY